ncbi:MAG: hypothetical protein JAY64_10660 [Candidatus Thiodiazotropha weberae]|nr:hypothetical protein [Candidatus Thiodiazotropha lotti]MCG8012148.1 hypothetical protein [Candidatus Thiodiazotropha lotti]MCW4211617.1 hypothetical protein [Candidatus Thiodiazotropha lotti]MCW4214584.1 hypothetical protein [Candidatus Thiodiazotropha lotti]
MDDNIITAIEAINSSTLSRGDNSLEIGYGASLTDISNFENSLSNTQNKTMDVPRSEGPSNTEKAISKPLDYINQEAEKIVNYAKSAVESGN